MTTNKQYYNQMMEKGHNAVWDQDWAGAEEFFRRAMIEKPEDFQSLTSLGYALYKLGKMDEARSFYLKAAKLSPSEPMPIEKLAQIYEEIDKLDQAAELYLHSAYLYLKEVEVEKAIQIWQHVTKIYPEHLKAHNRIAYVAEKIKWKSLATYENIFLGALLQEIGQVNEAFEKVKKAVSIDPQNERAINAFRTISANKTLDRPNPDDFELEKVNFSEETKKQIVTSASEFDIDQINKESQFPIHEARQTAVVELANLLFEATEEAEGSEGLEVEKPGGLRGFFKGNEKVEEARLANITKYIGSAIDHQSRDMFDEAIKDLVTAIDLGLSYPAVNFLLGFLYTEIGDQDRAHSILMRITESENYAIAANLLVSKHFFAEGIITDSLIYALQALKNAELSIVKKQLVEILNDHYERLIEDVKKGDDEQYIQFYENIMATIDSPDWRQNIIKAKEQIPIADTGTLIMPIAEILQQTGSSIIIESMAKINEYSRRGFLDTALEEAYSLLNKSPGYLPLQVKIADMLIENERVEEALRKFGLISQTYYSRGEIVRAKDLLLQVVEISPLHLDARNQLKDIYRELKEPKKVLSELLNIADIYYKLANLDAAKESYIEAVGVTYDIKDSFDIKKRILSTIADIDIQKLQWGEALETYKTMREIDPNDISNWKKIISLNIKLGNDPDAERELDDCLAHLSNVEDGDVFNFLQEFISENPRVIHARKNLADQYLKIDRTEDAILELDQVAQLYFEEGNTDEARGVIRTILGLEPANKSKYQDLLKELD
jgi:tetratricopeptide (TPR) repeat protein